MQIRIDFAGDGQWIMDRVGGDPYIPNHNHSLMHVSDDGERRGGFVLCQFTGEGGSIVGHMAGEHGSWLTRELLWMLCDYVFNQIKVRKFIAIANTRAPTTVTMDLRAGFVLEAVVKDGYPDGGHMMVLTMTREQCRWLKIKPKHYRPTYE